MAALWLLDAALQFQSFMFGPGFARMLADTAAGSPTAAAAPITWAAHLIGQHPATANAVFASGQAALGLGIAWRPATRIALGASIGWSLAVWWLGEGLGGLLAGTASPASGAPGAALVYALLAILLWPGRQPGREAPFPAVRGAGLAVARLVWLLLWGSLAWLAVADARASPLPALRHAPGSAALAASFALIAVAVLLPAPALRVAVAAAAGLSLTLWGLGQDFGGVFTGMGTDPGTGPVLALLAVAYWPARRPVPAAAAVAAPAVVATGQQPAGPRAWLPAGRDVAAMQVLMGLGMAGMLLPQLDPLPAPAWAVLAAAGTAWFGWRTGCGLARRDGHHWRAHLPHALGCAAMLDMALAGGPAMHAAASTGMGGAGAAPGPVAALLLATALAGCAVLQADRLPLLRPAAPVAAPADPAAAPAAAGTAGGTPLAPQVAACCQLAMGLAMACLLVRLL